MSADVHDVRVHMLGWISVVFLDTWQLKGNEGSIQRCACLKALFVKECKGLTILCEEAKPTMLLLLTVM
jgi:hypothetical protein